MAEAVGGSEFGSINQELRSNLDTPRRQVYQLDDIIIEMSVLYPTSSDRASWQSLRGVGESLCLSYGKSDHSSRTDEEATPQDFAFSPLLPDPDPPDVHAATIDEYDRSLLSRPHIG